MKLIDETVLNGNKAICRAFAKINLTLDILSKREDGYHEVEMIMQSINLYDTISVKKKKKGIKLYSNIEFLPTNEKNIAYKAAKLFFEKSGIDAGAVISLDKMIPVSAGLAGGSTDAAATLCCLNKLYNSPFTDNELLELSKTLGADVGFCMCGGTMLAKGIGERLERIDTKFKTNVLIVNPAFPVATAWAYGEYDKITKNIFPDSKKMADALKKNDFNAVCCNLSNVLESVTVKEYPMLENIKKKLVNSGADGALMSGSGPTVFAFFDDFSKAKSAFDDFSVLYNDVFLTVTC